MCLRRAPEKYIAGAALDRAVLDNQLTTGGEGVILTHWRPFTPQEDCRHSFLSEAESTPGPQYGLGLGKVR
jgi:hypothetical protein